MERFLEPTVDVLNVGEKENGKLVGGLVAAQVAAHGIRPGRMNFFLADCASANSGHRNGAIAHLRRAVNTLMTFVGCMCHVFDRGFRHLMLHDPWAKPMMRDPKLWHSAAEPRSEPVARTERHGHVPSSAVALGSWRRTAVRVSAAAKLFGRRGRP